MTIAAKYLTPEPRETAAATDQRAAPRFFSLIRAAKLIVDEGEFICVVRDVSSTGIGLRCFHDVPPAPTLTLELQNGDSFTIERVRGAGTEASFRFAKEVPIERLVQESALYPRRPLRLNVALPLTLRTVSSAILGTTRNLSQQGCRIEIGQALPIDQPVVVESPHLPGIRAKVRWRREGDCGLVFDDTFTLKQFAILAARLQCPTLIAG